MKKQKEAREKLTVSEKQISSQITPTVGSNQINTAAPQQSTSKNQSRADRLAELRKQSQESIKKTESILEPSVSTAVEPEIVTRPTVPNVVAKDIETAISSPIAGKVFHASARTEIVMLEPVLVANSKCLRSL